ncbi:4-hydroxy-tetrahydrodipicolinate synthase [Sinomicrobium weinanense]|uniref:4-hydroxy-tetrahydrodipicolinate synthase n=1 Tax=Sinomicrobium weinanense TaxID=2842200 RepID=A0A926JPY9_9FLAO|nr:4-hydroxy-tetrahydrodipicolinate synthase [Sinomicrobium weinanense]MBC9795332.1 4-hydroxy-tetrahydrodipicolinate synthase [Sinomicrobium weinanense]MBU3122953.1 4-hydroxy-tetrahydrodipicolinate synthase [Sinomicrobium weinanense]
MSKFTGTGVALVTPFNRDNSVDRAALERVVTHCTEGGVEYLVVLGTTGESATLTKEEKEIVKQTVIKANAGKLPLVLGIGGNNTAEVIRELQDADLSAFDAVLSVSPYYNKPTQEGIYQHFKAVAEASPIPVILYNVPGRTASNILPATVLRLARDMENIIGIKEAAGDIVQAMRLVKDKPEGFLVISGDDMITLPMVLAGGSGVISVIGQGFPREFSEMVRYGLKGHAKEAYTLHYKLMDVIDMAFEQGNPAGIKSILHALELADDAVRLPLVKVDSELEARISGFVEKNVNLV